eukprot:11216849-Lingulodinium_polyedra.AAC.1
MPRFCDSAMFRSCGSKPTIAIQWSVNGHVAIQWPSTGNALRFGIAIRIHCDVDRSVGLGT